MPRPMRGEVATTVMAERHDDGDAEGQQGLEHPVGGSQLTIVTPSATVHPTRDEAVAGVCTRRGSLCQHEQLGGRTEPHPSIGKDDNIGGKTGMDCQDGNGNADEGAGDELQW